MKKILLMAILFLSFQLQAKELASVTVGDQKVLQVKEQNFLGLWDKLSAEVNVNAEHQNILHGVMYGYSDVTGNFKLGTSFSIGPEGLRLACDEISLGGFVHQDATDAKVTIKGCHLDLGSFQVNYYEQFEIAFTKDELRARYKTELGVDTSDITFVKITTSEGCLLRSGPSKDDPPVARMFANVEIALLGDDRDHRGWIKALACTNEQGWVQVYVGKALTSMAGNAPEKYDEKSVIPPLAKLFE
jgi:hypothetical protein